jgi:hypothetical protein
MTASLIFSGRRSARSGAGLADGEAVRDALGAVGSSLLFGALVSGVVEVSFTLKNTLSKERRESTGNLGRAEIGKRKVFERQEQKDSARSSH